MASAGEFGVVDYVVFALMLLVSAAIGTFYAFCGGKQKTTKEYLLADRSMSSWPVAISLLASYLSAITLLGAPSEIFTYGSQYLCMVFFSYWIFCGAVAVIFIPVFYQCGIISVNEVG
jgi:Na+/proline symporter